MFARTNGNTSRAGRHKTARLRWRASVAYQVTLNIDGSVKTGLNRAGMGGVMRNNRGEWIEGFMRGTSYKDPSWVEAEAIVEGLRWAWQRGVRDIEIQTGAKNVIQWIQDVLTGRGPVWDYINTIKGLITKDWRISFQVIYREQNNVADSLASCSAMYRDEASCSAMYQ